LVDTQLIPHAWKKGILSCLDKYLLSDIKQESNRARAAEIKPELQKASENQTRSWVNLSGEGVNGLVC